MKYYFFIILCFAFTACSFFTSNSFLEEKPDYYIHNSNVKLPVFETRGRGLPIILIHGGPGLPGYMKSLADLLKPRKIIRYYQRESLLSKSNGPYDFKSQVDDLKSVVDNTTEKYKIKPIIIGHSLGAAIATEFSKNYGRLVSKVILISPAEYYKETGKIFLKNMDEILLIENPEVYEEAKEIKEAYEKKLNDRSRILAYHKRLRLFWPAYFPSRKIPNDLKFAMAEYRNSNKTEADYFKLVKNGDLRKGIEKIENYVIHIHGEKDILPHKRTRALFKEKLKYYNFREVKGAGHFPWLDEKSKIEFLRVLESYLE